MAKKPFLVPVSLSDHGILHDTDYARGASSIEEAAHIDNECFDKNGHMRWGADYIMQEVKPFTTQLKTVRAGIKASYVELIAPDGRRFPMFVTDYIALMSQANVVDGWIEPLEYEPTKKGARYYGIRLVS